MAMDDIYNMLAHYLNQVGQYKLSVMIRQANIHGRDNPMANKVSADHTTYFMGLTMECGSSCIL